MQRTVRQFTCDRCEAEGECSPQDGHPIGWAKRFIENMEGQSVCYDLCADCASQIKAMIDDHRKAIDEWFTRSK